MNDPISGSDILIKINGVIVGHQRNVSISRKAGTTDLSSKDSKYKKHGYGKKESDVSLDGLYVYDNSGVVAIENAYENDDLVTIMKVRNGTDVKYAEAVVTDFTENAGDGTEHTFSAAFKVSGAWISA